MLFDTDFLRALELLFFTAYLPVGSLYWFGLPITVCCSLPRVISPLVLLA